MRRNGQADLFDSVEKQRMEAFLYADFVRENLAHSRQIRALFAENQALKGEIQNLREWILACAEHIKKLERQKNG